MGMVFNQPFNDSLKNLTNLRKLNLGLHFNQPLCDSISTLTNLKILKLGDEFDQNLNEIFNLQHILPKFNLIYILAFRYGPIRKYMRPFNINK